MKVAICVAEAVPFAKTGGLADVAGALPQALKRTGVETIVVMPGYGYLFKKDFALKKVSGNIQVKMHGFFNEEFELYKTTYKKVDFYFVKKPKFFNREYLYGTSRGDYEDNNIRFGFFSRAIFEVLKKISFDADIIHLNDYHFGLAALILKDIQGRLSDPSSNSQDAIFKNTKAVFTIHNIAYQGVYEPGILQMLDLGPKYFNTEGLEFYGKVNYMKAGIVYSDRITTVSPTYSREILTPEYGYGLEGILQKRAKDLSGIINGIDYEEWNPETDKIIAANYGSTDLSGKLKCKNALLENFFGISDNAALAVIDAESDKTQIKDIRRTPVIGMVSRLSEQKGIDLIVQAMELIMENDLYLVILGTGDEKYQDLLTDINKKYDSRFRLLIGYSEKMSREIYAGSDIFLMPSNYEPCGLGQLISLKYGTIPVVRNTGGLADTVIDINSEKDIKNRGQGFKFSRYGSSEFYEAIKRALDYFADQSLWKKIISNAMAENFSWDYSAARYRELYESLK